MPSDGSAIDSRLRAGRRWVAAGRLSGVAAQALLTLLVARRLGPTDFGMFVFISSIVVPCTLLGMAGLNNLAVRYIIERIALDDRQGASKLLAQILKLALFSILSVSGALFAVLVCDPARWLGPHAGLGLVALVATWTALLAAQQLLAELFRAFHELRFSALLTGQSGGALANGLIIVLLLMGLPEPVTDLSSLLATIVCGYAVSTPLAFVGLLYTSRQSGCYVGWNILVRWQSPIAWSEISRASATMALTQLLAFAVSQGDIWIAYVLGSPTDVALLGVVKRTMYFTALPAFLGNMTIAPTISQLYAQDQCATLEGHLRRNAAIAFGWSLALTLPLLVAGRPLLAWAFGSYYADAAPLLLVAAIGFLCYVWCGSSFQVLLYSGRERWAAAIQLASALLLFTLGSLAMRFGDIRALVGVAAVVGVLQSLSALLLVRWQLGIWSHPCWFTLPAGDRSRETQVA